MSSSHNSTHHSTPAPPQPFPFGAAIAATIAADSDAATLVGGGAVLRCAALGGRRVVERAAVQSGLLLAGAESKARLNSGDLTHATSMGLCGMGYEVLGLLILFF